MLLLLLRLLLLLQMLFRNYDQDHGYYLSSSTNRPSNSSKANSRANMIRNDKKRRSTSVPVTISNGRRRTLAQVCIT